MRSILAAAMDPRSPAFALAREADFREPAGLDALAAGLEGLKVVPQWCRTWLQSKLRCQNPGRSRARSVHLGELALEFAVQWLQPGGDLVVKRFERGIHRVSLLRAGPFQGCIGLRAKAQG